mgnify:CR=1 FL=1
MLEGVVIQGVDGAKWAQLRRCVGGYQGHGRQVAAGEQLANTTISKDAHHYRAILPQGHGTTSCFELLGAHSFTSLLYGLRTVVCVQHHVGRAGAPPLMHHRVTRARRHLLL